MKSLLILSLFFLTACSSKSVRQEDLKTWNGQKTSTLESHPVFSTLPREERVVPGSKETLINFHQKKITETGSRHCLGTGFGFGNIGLGASHCSPREMKESSCVHQFKVENNTVIDYRVLGEGCFTDCTVRPEGSCSK